MRKSTNHYLLLSYLYFANDGIKIKAIPESPKINNSGVPCRCSNLNKTASMVMELKSAPEINAAFFILSLLVCSDFRFQFRKSRIKSFLKILSGLTIHASGFVRNKFVYLLPDIRAGCFLLPGDVFQHNNQCINIIFAVFDARAGSES